MIGLKPILPCAISDFDSDEESGERMPYLEAWVKPRKGVIEPILEFDLYFKGHGCGATFLCHYQLVT